MGKRVVYTRPEDGGVSIVCPCEGYGIDFVIAKCIPQGVSYEVIDEESIPKDRTFRNAWVRDGGSVPVRVDMPKARAIHRDRLRSLRTPLLEALDVQLMKAIELGQTQPIAVIRDEKQALRDVTDDPAIEQAQTPEELKSVLPAALTRPVYEVVAQVARAPKAVRQ